MSLDQHLEKPYSQSPQAVFKAALAAIETLGGNLVSQAPAKFKLEVKFPKVMLGKTLGERTYGTLEIRPQDDASLAVLDAYPLDAIERKLLFGARKGVTAEVVATFFAQIDAHL